MSSRVRVECAALSHQGLVRSRNEDHYLVVRLAREQQTLLTNLPEGDVPDRFEEHGYGMIVADGMGGMASGQLASRVAISTLAHLALHYGKWNLRIDERTASEVMERAERFYRMVDEAVTERGQSEPALAGMGATLTGAFSAGDELFIAHVGHSRAYLFRDGRLIQLTHDQTLAQRLSDTGRAAPSRLDGGHLRRILTDAIGGIAGTPTVDVRSVHLLDADCVLLCTDGLTEMIDDGRIASLLAERRAVDEQCRLLLDHALERGGSDNVTVVLARYDIPGT